MRVTRAGTVTVNGTIAGWVRDGTHCENGACRAATAAGARWHAIPRVGTLPTYHYGTRSAAVAAITRDQLTD